MSSNRVLIQVLNHRKNFAKNTNLRKRVRGAAHLAGMRVARMDERAHCARPRSRHRWWLKMSGIIEVVGVRYLINGLRLKSCWLWQHLPLAIFSLSGKVSQHGICFTNLLRTCRCHLLLGTRRDRLCFSRGSLELWLPQGRYWRLR